MGIYINPLCDLDARSKVRTILAAATIDNLSRSGFLAHKPGSNYLWGVCLVDNGAFVAAGVAFSSREAETFASPDDSRPRRYCLLSLEAIRRLDPGCAKYLESLSGGPV